MTMLLIVIDRDDLSKIDTHSNASEKSETVLFEGWLV